MVTGTTRAILLSNLYPGIEIEKYECVGLVLKRVACRTCRKNNLDGRAKLTYSIINRPQNYYNIAVRSNANDLAGMTKAIHATLFHVASSIKNSWHDHYPTGEKS